MMANRKNKIHKNYLPAFLKPVFFAWLLIQGIPQAHGQVALGFSISTSDKARIDEVIVSIKYKVVPQAKTTASGPFVELKIDTAAIDYISFYTLGYELQSIGRNEILYFLKRQTASRYEIILKKKNITLKEVEINAKATVPFYQKQNLRIFDYEILPNGNVLLVGDNQIYLVSAADSVIAAVENKQGVDSIIQDCSGKIYFKNRLSVFPVHLKNNSTILVSEDPLPAAEVMKTLLEIKACDKNIRMKEVVGPYNQQLLYVLQPVSKPYINYNFYLAEDKPGIEVASAERRELDNLAVPERMGEINWKQNKAVKDKMHREWVYEFFITKKIYTPIFIFRDTIYIFDHAVKKLRIFNYTLSDTLLEFFKVAEDSITYSKKPGWKSTVILDRFSGKFYTMHQNSAVVLSSIPTNGNRKIETITLPKKHIFVDKVRIYNHNVYYLWKDPRNINANKTLYKFEGR